MVLGILGSGSGSNMQAILDAIGAGTLDARIALVLSDNPDAYILELNADTDIEISLNPSGFDAVLIIFGEDNPEPDIADSEDPEATEEIAGSAAEGCYLIVVTSFEAEETGSYSLSVDEID